MYDVLYKGITKGLNIFIIQTPSRSDLRLRFITIVRSRACLNGWCLDLEWLISLVGVTETVPTAQITT